MDFYYSNIRIVLNSYLKEVQKRNPKYSLRALARDLEISHSTLSSIINGKRKPSANLFIRLKKKLKFDVNQKFFKSTNYIPLDDQIIKLTNKWYFNVLLELPLLEDFKPNLPWIAARVGIPESIAKNSIELLKKHKLIKLKKNGYWTAIHKNTSTIGNKNQKSIQDIKKLQKSFLFQQLISHEIDPIENCSQVGNTIAIDPKDLPVAREKIYSFLRELSDFLERNTNKPKKEIYRLGISLFPLTRNCID